MSVPETKESKVLTATVDTVPAIEIIDLFSSFSKLQGVLPYIFKVVNNAELIGRQRKAGVLSGEGLHVFANQIF